MSLLETLLSSATVYLLYAMGAFPFAIWAGRASYTSTLAHSTPLSAGWPSRAVTVSFLLLPALFIAAYAISGIGETRRAEFSLGEEPVSEWGPVLFLFLPPCAGLMLGYGFGVMLGRDRGRRA